MKQTILTLLFIFCSLALSAQGLQVKGVVTSADDGQPLPGVSISVKGTATGTLTDAIGAYTINVPANSTLVFSFVGMKPQEILVKSSSTLNVVMKSDVAMMEEVVVVGYGVQKKSVVTGAISSVKASDMQDLPIPRIEDALKGRTSGVTIASSSGVPGADATVNIRGITSINSASPLYVVDGVPVIGGIDYLNQGDIESIEVLKDAASAAIYGTQAAAGVILITTKKGTAGALLVNYNGYVGTQAPEHKLNLLNATEYATIRNEALVAAGRPMLFSNPQSLGAGTDWQGVIFNNNAMIQNHELSVSGGSEKSTYYASVAYFDQEGIVATAISNYNRLTVRLNSAHKVTKWLNFGNNVSYSHIKTKQGFSTNDYFGGVLASAVNLDPVTPLITADLNPTTEPYASHLSTIIRDANGYPYAISPYVGQEMTNPAAYMRTQDGNYNWSDNIVGNLYLEIQPIKGLQLRSSIGTKLAFWGGNSFSPLYFLSNTNSNLSQNGYNRSFNRGFDWIFTNTISYTRSFNQHNFTFLLGTEARNQSNTFGNGAAIHGIPSLTWGNASMNYSVPATQTSGWGYENQPYTLSSIFARVNYDYQGKYMLTGIIRRDGSSHFGSNNVYGLFPSVSVGWVVSQEGFWKANDIINYLKVRAGYGVNGNDNLSPFLYTSTIGSIGGYTLGNDVNYTGYGPQAPANPDLKWEQTSQYNLGIDAKLFKNFTAAVELFQKKTTGMLMQVVIPEYVGASAQPYGNIASMWDRGLELELGYTAKIGDLMLNLKGNASFTRNKITDIGSNEYLTNATMQSSAYEVSRKVVGQPVNEFYGFKYLGVFQSQAEINAYVDKDGAKIQPTAKPGDYKWLDVNGDGTINSSDRTWLGNPNPTFTYGFTFNLAYKGFDLVAFGQGVSGNKIFNELRRIDIPGANFMNSALGRWTGPGTSNTYARIVDGDPSGNFSVPSQFFLQDGSYFRIKTLQLGYNLPKSLIETINFSKVRVYVSVNNMFTLSKYEGYDPEIGGGQGIYGIDRGVYPQARSFMAGLDFTF
jgi:TonB-dependent starch-binding outer membrane protein SusC